ncbi:MAG: hypothetical protein AABM31_04895 [Actinomycetota bacterium]
MKKLIGVVLGALVVLGAVAAGAYYMGAHCEDLQPGLTATVLIDFRTAADAEPAVLELAPDPFADEESKAWTIP